MFLDVNEQIGAQGRQEWDVAAAEAAPVAHDGPGNLVEPASPPIAYLEKPRAAILALGRATPPNRILQSTYPDWYFNITNCTDKPELKMKMQRICKPMYFSYCLVISCIMSIIPSSAIFNHMCVLACTVCVILLWTGKRICAVLCMLSSAHPSPSSILF